MIIVNTQHDHGSRLLAAVEEARVLEDSSVYVCSTMNDDRSRGEEQD